MVNKYAPQRRRHDQLLHDKQHLYKLYWGQWLNHSEIARRHGVKEGYVRGLFDQMDIPTRSPGLQPDRVVSARSRGLPYVPKEYQMERDTATEPSNTVTWRQS